MKVQYDKPITYAAKYSDDNRLLSQSGGAFAAISDYFLENDGIVYGCILNDKFEAIHARAATKEERDLMRYSKYVQSNMMDVFLDVYSDLKNGCQVLFSGTSCQVDGLLSYLEAKKVEIQDKLFCVDIVCHGVPSPLVWRDYLSWERQKIDTKISKVICREKQKNGWHSHIVKIEFDNGKVIESNLFPRLFYSHKILRPACYKCPYKDVIHPADITIADYWGIEKVLPEFADNKGVSLVLVNNDAGKKVFDEVRNRLFTSETNIVQSMQRPLISPYDCPRDRDAFWKNYRNQDFSYIAKKYGKNGIKKNIKRIVRKMLRI